MADMTKPNSKPTAAKPAKDRKKLTMSMAMRRIELMMEQLDASQCVRLVIYAKTISDEKIGPAKIIENTEVPPGV